MTETVDKLLQEKEAEFEAYWDNGVVEGFCIFTCLCHGSIVYAGPIKTSPQPMGVNVILNQRDYDVLVAKSKDMAEASKATKQ